MGVTSTPPAALGQAGGQPTTPMGGGVYRLTTLLPVQRTYLPALFKQYPP